MICNTIVAALILLGSWAGDFIDSGIERRITFYWIGEPGSSITADGTIIDPAKVASGEQRIVAVSRIAERDYPMGSIVWVPGYGLYKVRDRTARWLDDKWPAGTVDILTADREMNRLWLPVFLVWEAP